MLTNTKITNHAQFNLAIWFFSLQNVGDGGGGGGGEEEQEQQQQQQQQEIFKMVKIHLDILWVMTPSRSVTTFLQKYNSPQNSGQYMETVCSSKMFVSTYQNTWCHNLGVAIWDNRFPVLTPAVNSMENTKYLKTASKQYSRCIHNCRAHRVF
jgi:hypothetical protein